jgi:transcriptional regulator with XRE-family HTH domain
MLGVSYSAVAKWERGDTPVELETLKRLASAFGIEPGSLLLDPSVEGKFDLVEVAHRILEVGDRADLEAWIEIGARMFGINPPKRTGTDGTPPPSPTNGQEAAPPSARFARRPRRRRPPNEAAPTGQGDHQILS